MVKSHASRFLFLGFVSVVLLLFFLFSPKAYSRIKCSADEAKSVMKKLQNLPNTPKVSFEVVSAERVPIKSLDLCEVVFELSNEGVQSEKDIPKPKFIVYYGDGFIFRGSLIKVEGNSVKDLTFERINAVNKDFFSYVSRVAEQAKKRDIEKRVIKEISLKKFNKIRDKTDARFTVKKGEVKAEVIAFIDPFCPHCVRMKNLILEEVNAGKVNAYFIFTPISPAGERISASVICDKKTDDGRLKAFSERYQNQNRICPEGQKKVEENVNLFLSLGGRGVPFIIVKKGDEIKVITGEVSKNTFESYLE